MQEVMKEREPPPPNLDFTVNPDDEEMYFKEPGQLLSVYQALEESNLFYIQNAQAGDHSGHRTSVQCSSRQHVADVLHRGQCHESTG
jgi:hypothetical protein